MARAHDLGRSLTKLGGLAAWVVVGCSAGDDGLAGRSRPPARADAGADAAACADCDAGSDAATPHDPCDAATEPTTGCPCDGPGEQTYCGQAYAKIGDQVVCGPGFMTCGQDERWGECVLNNAAAPPPT